MYLAPLKGRPLPARYKIAGALTALGQGFMKGRSAKKKSEMDQQVMDLKKQIADAQAEGNQAKADAATQRLQYLYAALDQRKAADEALNQAKANTLEVTRQKNESDAAYQDRLAAVREQNLGLREQGLQTQQQLADLKSSKQDAGNLIARYKDLFLSEKTPDQFPDQYLIRQIRDTLSGGGEDVDKRLMDLLPEKVKDDPYVRGAMFDYVRKNQAWFTEQSGQAATGPAWAQALGKKLFPGESGGAPAPDPNDPWSQIGIDPNTAGADTTTAFPTAGLR